MTIWDYSAYGGIEIETENLRAIIKGTCIIRKCPDCNGEGALYLHYASDNDDSPKSVSREFFDNWEEDQDDPNMPSVEEHDCDTCCNVGYIGVKE
jgi:hypothetical protein